MLVPTRCCVLGIQGWPGTGQQVILRSSRSNNILLLVMDSAEIVHDSPKVRMAKDRRPVTSFMFQRKILSFSGRIVIVG
jgi:hypothetical protein